MPSKVRRPLPGWSVYSLSKHLCRPETPKPQRPLCPLHTLHALYTFYFPQKIPNVHQLLTSTKPCPPYIYIYLPWNHSQPLLKPNTVTSTDHLNSTQNTGDPHQKPQHSEDLA